MPRKNLIIVRNGSYEDWVASNPILQSGEIGYDTTNKIVKFGDGVNTWLALSSINHSGLFGVNNDDHAQYVHINIPRNITAVHTFNNGLVSSGTIFFEKLQGLDPVDKNTITYSDLDGGFF